MHNIHDITSRLYDIAQTNDLPVMVTISTIEDGKMHTSLSIAHMNVAEMMQATLEINHSVYEHLSSHP